MLSGRWVLPLMCAGYLFSAGPPNVTPLPRQQHRQCGPGGCSPGTVYLAGFFLSEPRRILLEQSGPRICCQRAPRRTLPGSWWWTPLAGSKDDRALWPSRSVPAILFTSPVKPNQSISSTPPGADDPFGTAAIRPAGASVVLNYEKKERRLHLISLSNRRFWKNRQVKYQLKSRSELKEIREERPAFGTTSSA